MFLRVTSRTPSVAFPRTTHVSRSRWNRNEDLKYNHYFKLISATGNNSGVLCTLCAGANRSLATSKNSTSHFPKHEESERCTLQQEAAPPPRAWGPDTTQQKMDFGGRASSNPSRTELKRCWGGNDALKYAWFPAIIPQFKSRKKKVFCQCWQLASLFCFYQSNY